jgi:hypothetical protein
MAVESPAWANAASTYTAEQTRRAMFCMLARTGANNPGIVSGGLINAADMQLTAPASGLSVNVNTGECIIPGNEGGAQGAYYARVSSQTNLAISSNASGNPRIDTVVATVADSGYTAPSDLSGNQWSPVVLTGTPTSGATLGNLSGAATVPGSSLVLGYVLVPNGAANIITADLLNSALLVQIIGSRPAARAYRGNAWTLQTSATKVALDTVSYDPYGAFDVTTNHRYNVTVPGHYQVNAMISGQAALSNLFVGIFKNGAQYSQGPTWGSSTETWASFVADIVPCVSGDYLEMWALSASGGSAGFGAAAVYMSVGLIG